VHVVKLACELPEKHGVPLSQWDCGELATELIASGLVESISRETVRRILVQHDLKPWRVHSWLSAKVPRDEAFQAVVSEIIDLYTRPLGEDELVFCFDEKTSLQPRPRCVPSRAAAPGKPVLVEAEYERAGSLNLLAAFDTRTGRVFGSLSERKRAVEFLGAMEALEAAVPASVRTIHVVLDNLRVHKGKAAQAWFAEHPRFRLHFTPNHCSWLNQIEQWFGIIQRKLLRTANFPSQGSLADSVQAFIERWNRAAHPFNWTAASVAKVMSTPLEHQAYRAA